MDIIELDYKLKSEDGGFELKPAKPKRFKHKKKFKPWRGPAQPNYGSNQDLPILLDMCQQLGLHHEQLYKYLSCYTLSQEQMKELGYPQESNLPNTAYVAPQTAGSVCSSGSDDDEKENQPEEIRCCCRCKINYKYPSESDEPEGCHYHWGKLVRVGEEMEYSCCSGDKSSQGCTKGKRHVSRGVCAGYLDGYVKSNARLFPLYSVCASATGGWTTCKSAGTIYALDCEMCYTTEGFELTKVTLVSLDGVIIYDEYVLPLNPIIDYNTRFSGVTSKLLKHARKTLKDVQIDILQLINADTILIGHGLENDLKALRILHGLVVDTSVVFPHAYGFPYKKSLKSIAATELERDIQRSSRGHDSYEDALVCVELLLWKIVKDFFLPTHQGPATFTQSIFQYP